MYGQDDTVGGWGGEGVRGEGARARAQPGPTPPPPLPFQARYPGLQAEFFERAAAPIARREAVLALLGLAGPAAILAWGAKGAAALKLPITVGPQKPPALGPRDKL